MGTEFFLSVILPWMITASLVLIISVILLSIPKLMVGFIKLPLWVKIIITFAIVGGTLIRFYWTPFTNRIYYDEDRYLTYTVSFARYGKAESIVTATPKRLIEGSPDQAVRLTLPVVNAWILRFFGYREYNLFFTAKILSSLQIPLIFILSLLLFDNFTVAIFSTIGMAFLPNNIFWSTSITLDPYFVTFALFAMVASGLYAKKQNIVNSVFMLSTLFALLCVRIESFLFLPIIGLTILFLRKDSFKKTKKIFTKTDFIVGLLFIFLVGLRALPSISILGKQWCCADNLPLEAFYPSYFIRNLLPNIYNLFNRIEFPFMISILAIIATIKVKNKMIIVLLLWIFSYFIIYSLYYAGMFYTFEFSGSYGRYFLILTPAILMLAGLSVDLFLKQGKKFILIGSVIFAVTIIPLIINYRTLVAVSPYSKYVDDGPLYVHGFIENFMIPNTPKDSIILSNLPALSIMHGRSVSFLGSLMDDKIAQDFIIKSLKNHVKVYSTVPYNCVDIPQECEAMFKLVTFVPVKATKNNIYNAQFAEIKLLKE